MPTSHIKEKSFRGLMAVANKGALTLNAPKVSDSKGNPDGPELRLPADRWVLTVQLLKLQTIPSYSSEHSVYFCTPSTLPLSSFTCEGYDVKWTIKLFVKQNDQQLWRLFTLESLHMLNI